jgi:hypothetical protein
MTSVCADIGTIAKTEPDYIFSLQCQRPKRSGRQTPKCTFLNT